ncbi:ester cyclase [Pseudomonas moorei]|uniref:ester cyclase n=1 Tax=Pseudomonas moorei TaxID=395599 RepID=UPI001FF6E915|nr:ester cyclase [Pseudomonas moorei]
MTAHLSPAEIVEAMHAAFRARDLDNIATYWADDIHFVAPGVDSVGKDARIRDEQVWLNAFSENSVDVEWVISRDDEVVEFCVLGGLHTGDLQQPDGNVLPPTQRRITGHFTSLYRICDGKVVYQKIIYDRLGLIEQLMGAA